MTSCLVANRLGIKEMVNRRHSMAMGPKELQQIMGKLDCQGRTCELRFVRIAVR